MNYKKFSRIGLQILMGLVLSSILLVPATQVVSQGPVDTTNVEKAALAKVASISDLLPTDYKPFQVGSIRVSGGWSLLNLVAYPVHPDPGADLIAPYILLAIAHSNNVGERVLHKNASERPGQSFLYKSQLFCNPVTHNSSLRQ